MKNNISINMKIISLLTVLSLFLVTFEAISQGKNEKFFHFSDRIEYYIDSLRIDYEKYIIGSNSISSIYVAKDSTFVANGGKIFITLKKGVIFQSLNNIIMRETQNQKYPFLSFNIDEKTNIDSVGVKIDTSCIKKAEIVKDSLGKYTFTITTTDFEKRKNYQKITTGDGPLLIIR